MDYLIKTDDMYFISSRIKEINPYYELFFNAKTNKYEIHDLSNHICSLALIVPPFELDCRVIQKIYLTRRENMKKLFLTLEEENQKNEQKKLDNMITQSGELFSEICNYSSNSRRELSHNQIKHIVNKFSGEN